MTERPKISAHRTGSGRLALIVNADLPDRAGTKRLTKYVVGGYRHYVIRAKVVPHTLVDDHFINEPSLLVTVEKRTNSGLVAEREVRLRGRPGETYLVTAMADGSYTVSEK